MTSLNLPSWTPLWVSLRVTPASTDARDLVYSLLGLIKGAAQIPIDYTITLHELQERLKGTIAIAQDIPRALVPTGFAANPCVFEKADLSSLMPSSINGRFRHVPTTMLKVH